MGLSRIFMTIFINIITGAEPVSSKGDAVETTDCRGTASVLRPTNLLARLASIRGPGSQSKLAPNGLSLLPGLASPLRARPGRKSPPSTLFALYAPSGAPRGQGAKGGAPESGARRHALRRTPRVHPKGCPKG